MAYKSVKEILNDVFDSSDSVLKGVYKTEGEVLNMVLDETGDPALKVRIDGLTVDSYTKSQTDTLLSGKSDTGHNHNTDYLGITAKAADADKLDGIDSTGFVKVGGNAGALSLGTTDSNPFTVKTNNAERVRVDASGNVLVGVTTGSYHTFDKPVAEGDNPILLVKSSTAGGVSGYFSSVASTGWGATSTALAVGKNSTTGRSINAGGTVNTSGADYAEYMTKADDCGEITKGDVCGIDSEGKLTDSWADAVNFAVKSTNPSYVGGDTWGTEDILGMKPANDEELPVWLEKLEDARQKVDRIAFCGQVPVNVTEFAVGDYIIPVESDGRVSAVAVSSPTFEQFLKAVGKVVATEEDGRARIFVRAV